MTAPEPWTVAAAEARLGPAAVAAIREHGATAPPMREEQIERLRMIFAPAFADTVEADQIRRTAA